VNLPVTARFRIVTGAIAIITPARSRAGECHRGSVFSGALRLQNNHTIRNGITARTFGRATAASPNSNPVNIQVRHDGESQYTTRRYIAHTVRNRNSTGMRNIVS